MKKNKILLELTHGCTPMGFTICGTNLSNFNVNEKKEMLFEVVKRLLKLTTPEDILEDLVMTYGDCEYKVICDQCGDTKINYTLKL